MQNVKGTLAKGGRCISYSSKIFRHIEVILQNHVISSLSHRCVIYIYVFFFVAHSVWLNVSLPSAFKVAVHIVLSMLFQFTMYSLHSKGGIKYEYRNESM